MTDDNITLAADCAPIIENLHGADHPELTRVRELTQEIATEEGAARLSALFAELRTVTNGYAVPDDACEAYKMTYRALETAEGTLTSA